MPNWVIFLCLCIIIFQLSNIYWALRAILRRFDSVADDNARALRLAIKGRARQSTVVVSSGGNPPVDRPKQVGPRHSETKGARMTTGLRLTRMGGNHGVPGDTDDSGLQQRPGSSST